MPLNLKDLKILQQLDLNPRITTSALAKKVRLSQQVVDYRLRRLQEQKLIAQFGTIFNLNKLGYQQYRILFQLGKSNEEQKKGILGYLQKRGVYWCALIGGKWDLLVVVWVKDYAEFEHFLDGIFTRFREIIRDYDSVYVLYHEFYTHKFLWNNHASKPLTINLKQNSSRLDLDVIDEKILGLIKNNCRLSALETGRIVGVNYKTVQNHIRTLEQQGLIVGYRTFLKSEEIGNKAYLLLLSFRHYGQEEEKRLQGYSRTHPQITQFLKLFGGWSIMLHLRVKDSRELQKIIVEIKENYPSIGNYEIVPIFEDVAIDTFAVVKPKIK